LRAEIDVNANHNLVGVTALMLAVQGGHTRIVELLLSNGADINMQDFHKDNALSYAIYYNHVEIAKLLLLKGADFDTKNINGFSPFDIAIEKKHYQILEIIAIYMHVWLHNA